MKPKKIEKKVDRVQIKHSNDRVELLDKIVRDNIEKFKEDAKNYNTWVRFAIRAQKAQLSLETFLLFSQLLPNEYNEEKCIKKWESFKYDHDASDMIYFLKKHGIEINDLECSTIFINDDAMNDKEFDKF